MNFVRQMMRSRLLWVFCCIALVCAPALPLAAQTPAAAGPGTAAPAAAVTSARVHAIMDLDGPWRFQVGDDPRWADAGYDDSAWPTALLSKSLSEQGFDSYSGYGWYRLKLQPQQLAQLNGSSGNALDLLVTPDGIGQAAVYVNGNES